MTEPQETRWGQRPPRSVGHRRRRGSFWLRAIVSFGIGEGVYYLLRSNLGLSHDPAMLNAVLAGAGVYFIVPWRHIGRQRASWPEVEAAHRVTALPPASGVPMPAPVNVRATVPANARPPMLRGQGDLGAATAMAFPPPPPPRVRAPGASSRGKQGAPADEVGDLLEEARVHMLELRMCGAREEANAIRADLDAICDTSERLIARLAAADRPRLLYASRIESTLATTREVVVSFLDMEGGKLFVEEQRRAKIRETVQSEFLPTIVGAFQHFARKLDEPAVIDLEAAIKAMTTRLTLEGL